MKLTKRIATIVACACMAMTSMVSMVASAAEFSDNNISLSVENNSITPYAASSKELSYTGYKQEKDHWCWAACTQTILKKYGTTRSQSDIVKDAKGEIVDENGTLSEVKKVLDKHLAQTFTKNLSPTYSDIKSNIVASKLVILAGVESTTSGNTSDHAMICYGYDTSDSTKPILKVYDPAKGKSGTLVCSSTSDTDFTFSDDDHKGLSFTLKESLYQGN